jgi:hypothetical protein
MATFPKWDGYIRGAESVSAERLGDQAVISQVKDAVNFTNSVTPDQGAEYKAGADGQAQ